MERTSRPKTAEITQEAFDLLLDRLDADRVHAGEKYERLRRKLIQFFRWERTGFPEEDADEALNRLAKKLARGEAIEDLPSYLYGIARMIALEAVQRRRRNQAALSEFIQLQVGDAGDEQDQLLVPLLWDCLQKLPDESRNLILRYYQGERQSRIRNRQALAEEQGIPLNALRNRALRLRERLQDCVEKHRRNRK